MQLRIPEFNTSHELYKLKKDLLTKIPRSLSRIRARCENRIVSPLTVYTVCSPCMQPSRHESFHLKVILKRKDLLHIPSRQQWSLGDPPPGSDRDLGPVRSTSSLWRQASPAQLWTAPAASRTKCNRWQHELGTKRTWESRWCHGWSIWPLLAPLPATWINSLSDAWGGIVF